MSRQNPSYPVEQSAQDALALVTAVATQDVALIDAALENALAGTDHTMLAEMLAMLTVHSIHLIEQNTAQSFDELLKLLGSALAQTLNEDQ